MLLLMEEKDTLCVFAPKTLWVHMLSLQQCDKLICNMSLEAIGIIDYLCLPDQIPPLPLIWHVPLDKFLVSSHTNYMKQFLNVCIILYYTQQLPNKS